MANTASVCKQIEIDCTYDTESMQKYQVPVTYMYNIIWEVEQEAKIIH